MNIFDEKIEGMVRKYERNLLKEMPTCPYDTISDADMNTLLKIEAQYTKRQIGLWAHFLAADFSNSLYKKYEIPIHNEIDRYRIVIGYILMVTEQLKGCINGSADNQT